MPLETPRQRMGACKHLRWGGGVYVYVHGRVSTSTVGSRPWLRTELFWTLESETQHSWLCCLPNQTAGTNWQTLLESYQCGMLVVHTSDPTASLLLPRTMMRFVSDFISRHDWVAPDPCLDLGSSEAGSDITDSIHSPALGKIHRDYTVSRDHRHLTCLCLGGVTEGASHLSSTRWNMTNLINLC